LSRTLRRFLAALPGGLRVGLIGDRLALVVVTAAFAAPLTAGIDPARRCAEPVTLDVLTAANR
jgi:hypothetical protein